MGNPTLLNLDELELAESDITIVHQGTKHAMRVLTVDGFITQQKRQREYEKRIAAGDFDDENADVTDAVEIIKNSVSEFFPTLPVGSLETPKLFRIFAWLNELSAKVNGDASTDVVEDSADEEGKRSERGDDGELTGIDLPFYVARVMREYGSDYWQVLKLPLTTFWSLNRQVNRLRAEGELRFLRVQAVAQSSEGYTKLAQELSGELGKPAVVEKKFDEKKFLELQRELNGQSA